MGLRVRWRTVGKVAVLLCAALPMLRALPSLLEPGPPPPLAGDVGLTGLRDGRAPQARFPAPKAHASVGVGPARALGGRKERRPFNRERRKPGGGEAAAQGVVVAPPAEASPPPSFASPPPLSAPAGPAPPPSDGSEEFAPH